jgi:hypothetical protein
MDHRVGVGNIPLLGNITTDSLINQGIQAGVQWASKQSVVQQTTDMANTTIQGATLGAAIGTTIFPGIGSVVGTVAGALISFMGTLLSSVGSHECKLTLPDGEIPCANYGRNVVAAIDWLRTHPQDAMTMHNSSLAKMFNIAEGDQIKQIWNALMINSGGHPETFIWNTDDRNALQAASQMPSASDLLRIAQIPAAASWVSAQPKKFSENIASLQGLFPALTTQDVQQIQAAYIKVHPNPVALLPRPEPPKEAPSPVATLVKGVAVTAALGTVATFVYARITHRTFLQVVKSWVPRPLRGRRRNPLPSALGPTTGGRTLAYRVQLGGSDTIAIGADGLATYFRGAQAVALFRPTTYQLPKIRSGHGEVLIFTHQVLRTLIS